MTKKKLKNNLDPIIHTALSFHLAILLFLTICAGVLFFSMDWMYKNIDRKLGFEMAQISMAMMAIVISLLIIVGVRIGLSIDHLLRNRIDEVRKVCDSFRHLCRFLAFLGYKEYILADGVIVQTQQKVNERLVFLERPARRGRPPTYPFKRWKRVVLAWENRDNLRNPMTLKHFLCEEFGTSADGSPLASENSFYDNRKIVLEVLRKEAEEEKMLN
jgi:hypothetical protein